MDRTPSGGAVPARCRLLLAFALLLAGALLPRVAYAQSEGRSLYWKAFEVHARLDGEGRLHVRERQDIVFDGDWNGGYRAFRVPFGQDLELLGITRIDPATGAETRLEEGDLDDVDHYDWSEGKTVRWRSRLPDDPPFQNREIDYVLEYTIGNVVRPTEQGYLLDHDFAFPDREGTIQRFTLDLRLDPAWQPLVPFGGHLEATPLPPGRGYVVTLPLRYVAAGSPASVRTGTSGIVRALLLLLLGGGTLALVLRFRRRDAASGRFEPLVPGARIDEVWLRENILTLPPELIGAAWDRSTGSAEVAAMLARLVQEGKLSSRVEEGGRRPVLHLKLEAPRGDFAPDERALLDALFFDDREETDTDEIRAHYKRTGFDPASKIRSGLKAAERALPGRGRVRKHWMPGIGAVAAGLLLLVAAGIARAEDIGIAAGGFAAILGLGALMLAFAAAYSKRVVGLRGPAIGMLIPGALLFVLLALLLSGALESRPGDAGAFLFYHPGPLLMLGLVVLFLGALGLALEIALPGDTLERLALRRRIASARAFFREELGRPEPRLRDEWYPYVLAFGLGGEADRWFKAYGGETTSTGMRTAGTAFGAAAAGSRAGGSHSSSGWTGGGPLFGGGGGFGGGGAGRSWGAAASGMAASVAAPSSSGGGGGGIGASGGGGGGGW